MSVSGTGVGRDSVLAALRSSAEPQTVTTLSQLVGLHPNTVRGHLELLVHLGLARREPEVRTQRGRPRILYSANSVEPASTDAYRTLATVLANELSMIGTTDQFTSDQAGVTWAKALVDEGRLSPASSREEALEVVARLFDELGFAASTEPLGDRIYLQACPYASIRAAFPGVCELHLGLLRGALAATETDVSVTRMEVEPRPGLCIAHLDRPPTSPHQETA